MASRRHSTIRAKEEKKHNRPSSKVIHKIWLFLAECQGFIFLEIICTKLSIIIKGIIDRNLSIAVFLSGPALLQATAGMPAALCKRRRKPCRSIVVTGSRGLLEGSVEKEAESVMEEVLL